MSRLRLLAGAVTLGLFGWAAPAAAKPCVETFDDNHEAHVKKQRFSIEAGAHGITHLAIENALGNVAVEGYDGTALQIQTLKGAPDEDGIERLGVSLVPNPDGTVSIKTSADPEGKPLVRSSLRVDVIVHAPRDTRVEAQVGSGKLSVCNMDAGGDLESASGPIIVRNVQGELITHTVSGATQLGIVFGSVDSQTLTSDVALDTISGEKLFASVHKGRIDGRRVRSRDVELTTTEGAIMLEAEAALRGHLVVSSLKGDVDVRLRRHGPVIVRARASRIDLGATFKTQPDGWVVATFGTGEDPAHLDVRSNAGVVKLVVIDL